MSFKINLNPYSAAPYFTVSEHNWRFNGDGDINEDLQQAENHLRSLFNIPDEFKFEILSLGDKEAFCNMFDSVVVGDDPILGIRNSENGRTNTQRNQLLDLSYSFPQVGVGFSDFQTICIDPNSSLGIPVGFLLVFNRDDSILMKSFTAAKESGKDIYVLSQVLKDLIVKGKDMLLRESNYKTAVLYQMIESNSNLESVVDKEIRSKTMISARCESEYLLRIEMLGYDLFSNENGQETSFTIANYATHSKELIEMFADRVSEL